MNQSISRWLIDHPAVYALFLSLMYVIVRMADLLINPGQHVTWIFYAGIPILWVFMYLLIRFRVGSQSTH